MSKKLANLYLKLARKFANKAESKSDEYDTKMRVIIPETEGGSVDFEYVPTDNHNMTENKYPVEGRYNNAAFFFRDTANEVTFECVSRPLAGLDEPDNENKPWKPEGEFDTQGIMDVKIRTEYLKEYMRQKLVGEAFQTRDIGNREFSLADNMNLVYVAIGIIVIIYMFAN